VLTAFVYQEVVMRRARRLGMVTADGTTYKDSTDPQVVRVLESVRTRYPERHAAGTFTRSFRRVCLRYGDPDTGRDWGDRRECGRVGRTMGPVQEPILLSTSRSMGGGIISADKILLITDPTRRGADGVLYAHPKYIAREMVDLDAKMQQRGTTTKDTQRMKLLMRLERRFR